MWYSPVMRVDDSYRIWEFSERWPTLLGAFLATFLLAAFVAGKSAMADLETCLDRNSASADRIAACTDAIENGSLADPNLAAAVRERGLANMELGNHRAAIPDLTRAIRLEPKDVVTWMAKARAFLETGSLEGARRDFRRVLLLEPNNAEAQQGCIDVLTAQGHDNPTVAAQEHACAIVTMDEEAYAAAVQDREDASADENTPTVRWVHREFGDDVMALLAKMNESRKAGDWFRAAIYYTRAIELDPDAVLCRWQISQGFEGYVMRQYDMLLRPDVYMNGPIPRTLAEIQAVLSENPNDADALRERGLLFAASGGSFNAVDDLDAALDADPDSVELMVLSTNARVNVLQVGQLFWQFPDVSRSYLEPDTMLTRIEEAIARGADDLLTNLTYEQVLSWQPGAFDDPDLIEKRISALNRAIDQLPTWPEHGLKQFLAYRLYFGRGSALNQLGDSEAFFDNMDLALNPPGVESAIHDPRCYIH